MQTVLRPLNQCFLIQMGVLTPPKTLLGPYITSPAVWSPYMEKLLLKWWVSKDCNSLQTASKTVSYSAPLWVLLSLHKTHNLTPQTLCFVTGLYPVIVCYDDIYLIKSSTQRDRLLSYCVCFRVPAEASGVSTDEPLRQIQTDPGTEGSDSQRTCEALFICPVHLYCVYTRVRWYISSVKTCPGLFAVENTDMVSHASVLYYITACGQR